MTHTKTTLRAEIENETTLSRLYPGDFFCFEVYGPTTGMSLIKRDENLYQVVVNADDKIRARRVFADGLLPDQIADFDKSQDADKSIAFFRATVRVG